MNKMTGILLAAFAASMGGAVQALAETSTASATVTYEYPLYCVIDLSGGSATDAYHVAYLSTPPSGGFNTTEYKTTKLVLKRVDAGSFIMDLWQSDEFYRVTLPKPFYMGLYEVTQRQWELVTGSDPCSSTPYGKGDAYPVHYVSYDMIRGSVDGATWPESNAVDESSFLGKLRKKTGNLPFDLPTEAQWEYACRAGTTTTYSYGDSADSAYMWYLSSNTHEVGTKLPNKWGFYDMHGSVWEWCLDWYGSLAYDTDSKGSYSGSERVLRGGCWYYDADGCTSSRRGHSGSSYSNHDHGFRLSRTLAEAGVATVEFALGRICADGSSVDGMVSLGYAPTEGRNAVVAINDEVLLNASGAGSWTWYASEAGTYAVLHAVGDDVMSAAYAVTNGYAKAEEKPNPPMEVVDGIALSPSDEITVAAKGAKQVIKISGNGEAWTGATSAEWLKLNSESGTATKSIVCTIEENVDAEGRVGYVYIAGQTLKVTQTGRGATVNAQVAADTAGGEVAVGVSVTDETTTWSASSECPWIQVETARGTGSGEVKLQVLPWNNTTSRTGMVTVAGHTVSVTQSAATLAVSATSVTVVAQGNTVEVDVETGSAVEWAIADIPEWITLDGDTARRGMDSVVLVVSPNTTFEDRTATIKIAGKEFVATQDAAKVTLEGGATRCCNTSGFDTLIVTVRVDVATAPWTVAISEDAADWVFLMSDEAPAVGDGTFELYVPPEEGDSLPRTATVTIGNATLTIKQDDGVVIDGGNAPFIIPAAWFAKYPALGGTTVDEWQEIAEGAGMKTDASGTALPVWHDYVAGTDPTDAASRFTAEITLEDGKPVVTWTPALNGEGIREGERIYRVWGKANLDDAAWSEVEPGGEAGYRFFRVTVEMP